MILTFKYLLIIQAIFVNILFSSQSLTSVELKSSETLKNPVTLAKIKADNRLKEMMLVKIGRLSVSPVTQEEFDIILEMGK